MAKKINLIRILLYGFLTWLIPFGISIVFYSPQGELIVGYDFFKSLMVVIGSLTGCLFLVLYFRKVEGSYLSKGIRIGLLWLGINIFLDTLFLLPMMETTFTAYFVAIGLRYTVLLITSVMMGYLLKEKLESDAQQESAEEPINDNGNGNKQ